MKSKKQIFSLLLTLCFSAFLIGILPGTVSAAETASSEYGIIVNGVEVTDDNKNDILGENDGEAKSVTFDPDTNTLTLNNASFATDEHSTEGSIIWKNNTTFENLTICAIGDNRFTSIRVLPVPTRTLTFTGSGTITLTGKYAQIDAYSLHHYPTNFVFDGITLSVEAGQGLEAIGGNNITIKNGANVIASARENNAIRAVGQINIINSTVTASATHEEHEIYFFYGINSENSLSVTGNTEVIVVGSVRASDFTITPGDSGLFEVFVGDSEDDAKAMEGSPFEESREMSNAAEKYFYFHSKSLHKHTSVKTEAKKATCTEDGNIEYWHCPDCGKYFSDEDLTNEITQDETVIPAINHKNAIKVEAKAATCTEAGNIAYWYCPDCGKYFSDEALTEEITQDKTVIAATGSATTDTTTTGTTTSPPQTGDSSQMTLWVVLLAVSFGGLVGVLIYGRKRKCKH